MNPSPVGTAGFSHGGFSVVLPRGNCFAATDEIGDESLHLYERWTTWQSHPPTSSSALNRRHSSPLSAPVCVRVSAWYWDRDSAPSPLTYETRSASLTKKFHIFRRARPKVMRAYSFLG